MLKITITISNHFSNTVELLIANFAKKTETKDLYTQDNKLIVLLDRDYLGFDIDFIMCFMFVSSFTVDRV